MTFQEKLQQLESQHRLRSLNRAQGIDLTSNDYLGLSRHPALRDAALRALDAGLPAGAAASRLLRGTHEAHEALEVFAATYFGAEKALYFPNGFMANYALFTTLPERHDVVLYDALVHASIRDGIHAGSADAFKVPHNDLDAFEAALKKYQKPGRQIFMVVDSVYSMDGDLAPVADLQKLAVAYDAFLVVDEAHGTGVFGANGKGVSEGLDHTSMIVLHTCGKALGVSGGLICADAVIIDYMINRARPFIYSTAPPPMQALLVQKALELVQAEPWRREKLFSLRDVANNFLGMKSASQIIPIMLGNDDRAVRVASLLQQDGYDVRAIRPPTVPEGAARLRISLNIDLDEKILNDFSQSLKARIEDTAL